uniref:Uncharacterized protein n=1 Tax=Physcomitrium patens TaxID=3218 RepID=A0A2K1L7T1_PHYPA|nr:hypothetical protein PHYPA_000524 [Physcomitrium patens]
MYGICVVTSLGQGSTQMEELEKADHERMGSEEPEDYEKRDNGIPVGDGGSGLWRQALFSTLLSVKEHKVNSSF